MIRGFHLYLTGRVSHILGYCYIYEIIPTDEVPKFILM